MLLDMKGAYLEFGLYLPLNPQNPEPPKLYPKPQTLLPRLQAQNLLRSECIALTDHLERAAQAELGSWQLRGLGARGLGRRVLRVLGFRVRGLGVQGFN